MQKAPLTLLLLLVLSCKRPVPAPDGAMAPPASPPAEVVPSAEAAVPPAETTVPAKPVQESPAALPESSTTNQGRVRSVAASDPLYARVEGASVRNDCKTDAQCVKSGCSSEVCSSEQVMTTCEVRNWPHKGSSCGCVSGECVWYRAKKAESPKKSDGAAQGGAAQGMPCPDGRCAKGLHCLRYYGIAGPAGPQFTSCEIPCGEGETCPQGQSCTSIADGPGPVCRRL